jgi:hypothetical protein
MKIEKYIKQEEILPQTRKALLFLRNIDRLASIVLLGLE